MVSKVILGLFIVAIGGVIGWFAPESWRNSQQKMHKNIEQWFRERCRKNA